MARRGATGLSGVLVIDKPAGCTSHDVVARLRKATGEKRIGHTGTLDPMATGALIVLVGSATRLARYLSVDRKSYLAHVEFGTATDTLDADGHVVSSSPVPPSVLDALEAERVLATFLGPQTQIPPAFSAIKRQGVPAYRLARDGADVTMEPREIEVHEAALSAVDPSGPTWQVRFSVSKGTYIRSLARDIGAAAGTDAHLSALRRTQAGVLGLEHAVTLEDACAAASEGRLPSLFIDPLPALGFPHMTGDPASVRTGRALPAPAGLALGSDDRVSIIVDGRLGAVYRLSGSSLVPETVFVPEVAR
jgi:tRNA pseudouridine55 synthase